MEIKSVSLYFLSYYMHLYRESVCQVHALLSIPKIKVSTLSLSLPQLGVEDKLPPALC